MQHVSRGGTSHQADALVLFWAACRFRGGMVIWDGADGGEGEGQEREEREEKRQSKREIKVARLLKVLGLPFPLHYTSAPQAIVAIIARRRLNVAGRPVELQPVRRLLTCVLMPLCYGAATRVPLVRRAPCYQRASPAAAPAAAVQHPPPAP